MSSREFIVAGRLPGTFMVNDGSSHWECDDCSRYWPLPGTPPLDAPCARCGGPWVKRPDDMSDHRPTVALLVMTDGRDELLGHTILSFLDRVNSSLFTEFWMFDDTGLIDHRGLVRGLFPDFQHMPAGGGRRGFGGAIREAWAVLREHSTAEFIFHLEDDFTFNRRIPVDRMANLLRVQPWLAQVALRRQAWNDTERAAGGVVETNPDAYTQTVNSQLGAWLEHSLFWTTNPSLYRREIMLAHDWPDGDHSEGVFTHQLRDAGYRFAYWGRRDDEPWVHHIGEERAGTGY